MNTMAPDHRAQPPRNKLQEWFPNTKLPVIISAPMKGVTNGTLAGQVSKAGGFGTSPACMGIYNSDSLGGRY